MPIVRKLQAIGGSRAVIVPRVFLDQLGLTDDSKVEISFEGDHIVIAPHRPTKAAARANGAGGTRARKPVHA